MDVNQPENKAAETAIDIGALLCEARDNLGLTTKDVANELNLALDIISNIENNQFEQAIPSAFIRGYIKSYATKVGLNTAPLLKAFDQQTGIDSPSLKRVQTISTFNKRRKEINSGNYLFKSISIIIVVLFISFAGWELWKRYAKTNEVNSADTGLTSIESGNEILLSTATELTNNDKIKTNESAVNSIELSTSNTSELKQAEQTQTIQNQAEESSAPTSSLQMSSLVLDFSADCWVKIIDARGEVIALGVKKSGKHMPLEGVAPFNVILGDPSVVTMYYLDQTYDLSSYRAGRRAEIVLN